MKDKQGKPIQFKIAGFTIKLSQIIAIGVIAAVIAVVSLAQSAMEDRRAREEYERRMAELAAMQANQPTGEFDLHAQIQASLRKQFGDPPEGFEWGYTGELVALGDDDHTCEDVVYMFLRSLSILDFSTASRYSEGSTIIEEYQNYYGIVSEAITDYYRNFLRKQFKVSLTSLEIGGISDVAVFADGTEYLTITCDILDLTDKDFWQADRNELFQNMRVYRETETDTVKMETYVYDYIYSKYEEGAIAKRSRTIELVVKKDNGGGWLVSGDRELCAYLEYENGVDVARYILSEFESWYMEVTLQEQLEAVGGIRGDLGRGDREDYDYSGEDYQLPDWDYDADAESEEGITD